MTGGVYNIGKNIFGGGCFITTAVCGTLGKPDDCEELTLFRRFRDTYMRADETRREDVRLYYAVAPAVCARIDRLPDKEKIYTNIWKLYLEPLFTDLKEGYLDKVYRGYKAMVLALKETYL
jgi:hypothetical protein